MKGKPVDDTSAEKIKAAAQEVFLDKGYDGATMQAIADKAGFNKAQLHYYFRSKDHLFLMIFQKELQTLIQSLLPLVQDDVLTAREKLEGWIDTKSRFLRQFPKLPLFLISEIQRNPDLIKGFLQEMKIPMVDKHLLVLNEDLKKKGKDLSMEELLTMVYSLLLFPILAGPLLSFLLGLTPEALEKVQNQQVAIAKDLLDRYLF